VSDADETNAKQSFLARNHFLLRRLHSLSGILPVGVFVIMHLFTNAQLVWGQEEGEAGYSVFQHEVDFIHSIPALLFIEIALWGSIGFHAALGLWYTFTGKHNVQHYKYKDNYRYTLQRITGIVALLFIFLHIATLRWRWDMFGWFTPFWAHGGVDADGNVIGEHVPMSVPYTAYALQYSWLVVLFYFIGVMSVVYHWSNGLWTAAISWGITTSEAAMKRWGYACAGLFVALTVFFLAAMGGALTYDLIEDTTNDQKIVLAWSIDDEEMYEKLIDSVETDVYERSKLMQQYEEIFEEIEAELEAQD
jgi:succinate dehydrogenase / fumarate reductase cytochrome b subunit